MARQRRKSCLGTNTYAPLLNDAYAGHRDGVMQDPHTPGSENLPLKCTEFLPSPTQRGIMKSLPYKCSLCAAELRV